ncbi:MAG: NFACT RNA binding domain-containing protein [Candidatus Bipolaricaulota bacterium]|nr:NFACT family protein [Candidatus Bipolaricaulota bacterium]MDW8110341.1 NFACT RNA binding domain-containing protein [Candidatus Bipolaricaulota bacterium]
MDGLTLRAMVTELQERVCGARIQQIYHPRPTTLTIELWAGADYTLLLELGQEPRVHLTSEKFCNPPVPSAFAMLLRKYIKNGTLRQVAQPGLERIIDFSIVHGELYTLRCELLGRQSNVILLSDQKILGALKPVVGQRSFRPGEFYQLPSSQNKLDPLSATFADFCARWPEDTVLSKALVQILDGIGPRLAQEIALRAQLDPALSTSQLGDREKASLWEALQELLAPVRAQRFQPILYFAEEKPLDAAPFPLTLYAHLRGEPRSTLSEALDEWARATAHAQTEETQRQSLQRWLRERLAHTQAALERVDTELRQAQRYETLKHEGELILAHLDKLHKGMTEATLEDFHTNTLQTVQLDPTLSPVENAQKRFERYKKLKRAEIKLRERQALLQQELQALEKIARDLESAHDLSVYQEVLHALGYRDDQAEPPTGQRGGPRLFLIRGYRVLVGRSSRENDRLIREAAGEDYWLHARDRAGAHVIIKNPHRREIPPDVLEQAAQLAAYYSKGRDAKRVPVSYTKVKYLRKPKGARPGAVLLAHEEGTLLVTPKGDLQ